MFVKLPFLLLFPTVPVALLLWWVHDFTKRRNRTSRRPFVKMPRPAGWSLQSRTEDLLSELLFSTLMLFGVGMAAWVIYAMNGSLTAGLLFGLVGSIWMGHLARRTLLSYANHKLGLAGEQVVGSILDRQSSDTVSVFHDLEIKEPGKKPWNIDHVVLSPAGVFVFETKTRRKPKQESPEARGQKGHEVVFDGVHLHFPHPMRPDRHGIAQAVGNADWLREKLSSLNGADIPVSAALVLPGWYVTAKGQGTAAVLNENQIKSYLGRRPVVLSEERLRALTAQLADMSKVEFG